MTYTAFSGEDVLASGSAPQIARAIAQLPAAARGPDLLVFDNETGRQTDIDLRLAAANDSEAPRGPGRPRLGVVSREVTLLPRHWDWLASRPEGASAALRRLVDEARKVDDGRIGQEAAYAFLTAIAGNRPAYEEAIRALFAGDRAGLERHMAAWPAAIRDYALMLAYGRPGD